MGFCHGNGELARDGCCYVAGEVCPLRWKIVDGRILEGPDLTDLGTVAEFAATVSNNPNVRRRITDQAEGLTFACRAAVDVLVADPRLLTDRPGFEAAWNAHPDYVAQVRPHWAAIEQMLGLAEGEYQCSSWTGVSGNECCFAEPQVENEQKAAGLSADAKTVRQAGGR